MMRFGLPVPAVRTCMGLTPRFRITDAEAVAMSRYLVQHDGLFLGSSSACNLVACVKFVKQRGWREGQRLVTILSVVVIGFCGSHADWTKRLQV